MKLIYVAGKGGVGKSVCSAATGIWASEKGLETLVFSMDPAHSLSDIFDIDLGSQPNKIKEHLFAYEPDLAEESRSFFRRYKNMITALFGLFEVEVKPEDFASMPGVSELIFMDKLNDIYVQKKYDLVVIDSAPTAMVLPLLQLPSITTGFVTKVLGIRNKWIGVLNMLESGFGDSILKEVRAMRLKAETMRNALTDPKTASITVVTIPEKAAVEESRRLIETVQSHGVNVSAIVINHVIGECPCQFCQEKMASQTSYIQDIRNRYHDKDIVILPDYGGEVKGDRLNRVAEDLYVKGQMEI
ncbi:MAG TPA: TRC40/GET3/ArsA family transport-energizing ATPase [Methanothrix soehngenii]|jgi:arsenite-transporting ATPase|uniref:TRC40/GET3/ArsA family transport-energizing ATPase n=3 Tax=root TaxID=1 RepID=A0A7K4AKZ1_METSH|nr:MULTISPECIES: TRC40/GET3/ArsA family transport-energizing ATPase [Methanothrix]NYT09060.1 TRC40/GET3/ArsA family transport-energizing ATPase [Methanosarcinales archaeon]OPX76423.1 MAG: putative arsenical pump-driving ATPase [Methanosaeta sp. PtaB.Bin005]AEB68909.1 putative arsenical pump-driving ATPase [Methanothrix soehngenii GP6]MBP7067905.1 ArsA family ATPase [Methanothrix sp.]MDD3550826.1 TRC40/GET3/ArsA family transport-energizing ATPase [Methanothrix soehngenii]